MMQKTKTRVVSDSCCGVLVAVLLLAIPVKVITAQESLVNLSHLEHLGEDIVVGSDSARIIHVYANYPAYEWVDAKESGPEGIACVDDAGRAAVLYLLHFERTGSATSLARAKQLLRFVLSMQADDGQFYNFIHSDRSVNRNGTTSFKSFGWWASRGVWALGVGYRVLGNHDPAFAGVLGGRLQRSLPHIDSLLVRYGRVNVRDGYRVPQWLMYESAADATSELVLGLAEWYSMTKDPHVRQVIEQFADGFMLMQDGDIATGPFGLHRSWETMWHMWGNSQTQALALSGRLLEDSTMVRSAEREARGFYTRLFINGFLKEMDLAGGRQAAFEQIAYGVRPMAVGLVRLYEATGNDDYLVLAGLAASWLFGNNVAGQPMYDPATGRCFDGIRDSATVNKNSGAESTIEALLTVLEVERYPEARRFIRARMVEKGTGKSGPYAIFSNPAGETVKLALDIRKKNMRIERRSAGSDPRP